MTRRVSTAALAGLVLMAATHACYSPTEATVDISTDLACPPDGSLDTAIFVSSRDAPNAKTNNCAGGEIGTVVVAPKGSRDSTVTVDVVMGTSGTHAEQCRTFAPNGDVTGIDPSCVVGRRTITFVPHESLSVPVKLYADCLGVLCGAGDTCFHGGCVSSACSGDGCKNPAGVPPGGTVPPPLDGGVREGGTEGGTKGPCTAPDGTNVLARGLPLDVKTIAANATTLFLATTVGTPTGGTTTAITTVDRTTGGVGTLPGAVPASPSPAIETGTTSGGVSYVWWTMGGQELSEYVLPATQKSFQTPGLVPQSMTFVSGLLWASGPATNAGAYTFPLVTHSLGSSSIAQVAAEGGELLASSSNSLYAAVKATGIVRRYGVNRSGGSDAGAKGFDANAMQPVQVGVGIDSMDAATGPTGVFVARAVTGSGTADKTLVFVQDSDTAVTKGINAVIPRSVVWNKTTNTVYYTIGVGGTARAIRKVDRNFQNPSVPVVPADPAYEHLSPLVVSEGCVYFHAADTGATNGTPPAGTGAVYVYPQ